MSSSEEDQVRRPGRSTDASRHQTLSPSAKEDESDGANGDVRTPLSENALNDDADEADDLFGSDGEGEERPRRTLEDEELDSGDDEGRYDRVEEHGGYEDGEDGAYGAATLNVMDVTLGRAPEPISSNGEIYTMVVPNFLSLETEEFNPETYVAPPYATAATSLCWRYAPQNKQQLESNARIIRWEDGSMTLQLASNPREQYRLAAKPLAPLGKSGEYEAGLDSHAYLGAAAETASLFRLTSHLTHALTVLPTSVETDDAVQRLQEAMAAAARGNRGSVDGGVTVIDVKVDPELAKKQAELAEREKLRQARRREQLADRDLDRGRRVGMPFRTGGAGLTAAGLEDDDGMRTTRPRARKSRANRRGEIYTDEEDEYDRRGRTREDEYDKDDGFLVGSDEELEIVDDDEEEEEELDDDEDLDAEGEIDDEVRPEKPARREREKSPSEGAGGAGSPPTRKKHRYVVESDEE